MTFSTDIEKTEAEIKVLQKKLELLKEIETHKSQPRMEAERSGEVHIVFYNKKTYYRIEYTDEYGYVVWWRREKEEDFWDNASRLVMVTDKETERLLEGLWFNDVRKERYTDEFEEDTTSSTLYEMFYNKGLVSICDTVCDIVADWLPDEDDGDDRYACGWNDCVEKLKLRLK